MIKIIMIDKLVKNNERIIIARVNDLDDIEAKSEVFQRFERSTLFKSTQKYALSSHYIITELCNIIRHIKTVDELVHLKVCWGENTFPIGRHFMRIIDKEMQIRRIKVSVYRKEIYSALNEFKINNPNAELKIESIYIFKFGVRREHLKEMREGKSCLN